MTGPDPDPAGDPAPPGTISRMAWRILPLLGVAYLFAYMDRVNISFAALQMNADARDATGGFGAGLIGLIIATALSVFVALAARAQTRQLRLVPQPA
jgi:hypothetical protein